MQSTNVSSNQYNKVAVIGAGYWGKNLVRNFYELGVLSLIVDPCKKIQEQMSTGYVGVKVSDSYAEALHDKDIRGIAIATPAETHGALVREALLAEKDVYVEKPLCLSESEGRELIQLASEKKCILMVGHLLWYHPVLLKLKDLVRQGELGRIRYIYSNRLNMGKLRREENVLWSFAPHDVSVILGLLEEMPETVNAQGGNYLHQQIADVTVSLLSFSSGVKAHIFVSWLHPFKEQKLIVVGDRQMAVFDDVENDRKLLLYPHAITWKNHLPVPNKAEAQPVRVDSTEPLRAECLHFLDCIRTRQTPRTDGVEGLRVLKVLQRCQEALTQKASPEETTASSPQRSYFVHESSFIEEDVEIGEGTKIWHFSHVLRNSRIGKDCTIGQNAMIGPNVTIGNGIKIQNNVSVYEGVTLEDGVFCGPSVVFTNVFNPRSYIRRMDELRPTLVRRGASLGANCTVVCGVTIGQYAFIGAGAVVLKDIPDFALVVGNPGRIIGWMCACGNRIDFNGEDGLGACRACLREYRKTGLEVSLYDEGALPQSQSSIRDHTARDLRSH